METISQPGIFQPCPGVWYYPDIPQELIDRGELLTKRDFQLACQTTGQDIGQATYAFNHLIFSMEFNYRGDSYSMDTFYDLKDPTLGRSDSYFIECQAAADLLNAYENGKASFIGYGPKTLFLLKTVLYDVDPDSKEETEIIIDS